MKSLGPLAEEAAGEQAPIKLLMKGVSGPAGPESTSSTAIL